MSSLNRAINHHLQWWAWLRQGVRIPWIIRSSKVDDIISGSHHPGHRVAWLRQSLRFDRNLCEIFLYSLSDNCRQCWQLRPWSDWAQASSWLQAMTIQLTNRYTPCWLYFHLPDAPNYPMFQWFSPVRKEMEIKQTIVRIRPDAIFTSDDLAIFNYEGRSKSWTSDYEDLKIIGYDGTYFVKATIHSWQLSSNRWKILLIYHTEI